MDGIIANARLRETAGEEGFSISPVNAASQERVWCCGRICAEGDAASLNPTSVMLEGANGRRVKLDLTGVPEFAVFPGQVVVVNGHNSTGSVIKVLAIYCDASMPVAKTPASQVNLVMSQNTAIFFARVCTYMHTYICMINKALNFSTEFVLDLRPGLCLGFFMLTKACFHRSRCSTRRTPTLVASH